MEGALSASEQAFFESGGETEIIETPAEPSNDLAPQGDLAASIEPAVVQPEVTGERDEKGRFVPHQALHAEREEHKKTKSQLEEIGRKQAVLEDRWNTLLKLNQTAETQQPTAPPDPNEDIFAFSKWQAEQMEALKAKVEGREQQEQQTRQEAEQEQALWGEWSQSAQFYATRQADFGDAVKFLSDARDRQLQALSIANPGFANEQGRVQQINNELKSIVLAAKQQGMSPAEAVYKIAQGYGYAVAAPQPTDPNTLKLPDSLAKIEAAQNASRSLAASPGRDAGDPMSAEAIANMSNAEFDTWYRDPANAKRFDTLMRG
jgi:hypothetical protein